MICFCFALIFAQSLLRSTTFHICLYFFYHTLLYIFCITLGSLSPPSWRIRKRKMVLICCGSLYGASGANIRRMSAIQHATSSCTSLLILTFDSFIPGRTKEDKKETGKILYYTYFKNRIRYNKKKATHKKNNLERYSHKRLYYCWKIRLFLLTLNCYWWNIRQWCEVPVGCTLRMCSHLRTGSFARKRKYSNTNPV